MLRKLKGGLETVIAIVIITGLVVAILIGVVIPTAQSGDNLLSGILNNLFRQQPTIGPQ